MSDRIVSQALSRPRPTVALAAPSTPVTASTTPRPHEPAPTRTRPARGNVARFWVQRHPSGARVALADGNESRELAAAVAGMVAALPMRTQPMRIEGAVDMRATMTRMCTCFDCLSCELRAMRSRRGVRHV